MRRIGVFSLPNNLEQRKVVERVIKKDPALLLSTSRQDMIICVGGDGTFFFAERAYPGVPKLLFRQSAICNKCSDGAIRFVLARLKQGRFRVMTAKKVEAVVAGRRFLAVNDIILRNREAQHAIRFSVNVKDKMVRRNVIGDGVVVATAYGSTAYFHAITGKTFSRGMGIAFNNATERIQPLFIAGKVHITLTLLREQAVLVCDNDPRTAVLRPGQSVTITTSKDEARIITLEGER